jgi:hypothetical protein
MQMHSYHAIFVSFKTSLSLTGMPVRTCSPTASVARQSAVPELNAYIPRLFRHMPI